MGTLLDKKIVLCLETIKAICASDDVYDYAIGLTSKSLMQRRADYQREFSDSGHALMVMLVDRLNQRDALDVDLLLLDRSRLKGGLARAGLSRLGLATGALVTARAIARRGGRGFFETVDGDAARSITSPESAITAIRSRELTCAKRMRRPPGIGPRKTKSIRKPTNCKRDPRQPLACIRFSIGSP
jgi:hypothetical protein